MFIPNDMNLVDLDFTVLLNIKNQMIVVFFRLIGGLDHIDITIQETLIVVMFKNDISSSHQHVFRNDVTRNKFDLLLEIIAFRFPDTIKYEVRKPWTFNQFDIQKDLITSDLGIIDY